MNRSLRAVFVLCLGVVATPVKAVDPSWAATMTRSPVAVRQGELVTFSAPLIVLGGPVRQLQVVGGVGPTRLLDKTFAVLQAGARQTLTFKWQAEAGTHTAYFEIDPQQRAADVNRDHNRITLDLTVTPLARARISATAPAARQVHRLPSEGTALPDIALIHTAIANDTTAGREIRPGDRIGFEVTLKNQGQANTGVFYAQLEVTRTDPQVSGRQAHSRSRTLRKEVPDLRPNDRHWLHFDIGIEHVAMAQYAFEFVADHNNGVIEFNERNNDYIGDMVVRQSHGRPDLGITLLSPDPERRVSRPVLLRGVVVNRGDARTGPEIRVTLSCEGKDDETKTLPGLAVGKQAAFEFTHRWYKPGDRQCTAEALTTNESLTDRRDNTASLIVRIK